jgi:flotillin
VVIPAEIAKQRAIIEAQAEAKKIRENARGDSNKAFQLLLIEKLPELVKT